MVADPLDESLPVDAAIAMVFKTMKNAFIYGYRVRFLHSLAYQLATLKLRTPNGKDVKQIGNLLLEIINRVYKSAKMGLNHGKILAGFAIVYRCGLVVLNWINGRSGSRVRLENHYIAGLIGGCLVYSGLSNRLTEKANVSKSRSIKALASVIQFNESILTQVTMYTLSRLMLAVGRDFAYELTAAVNKRRPNASHIKTENVRKVGWIVSCGIIWGGIMMYYRRDGDRKERKKEYLQRALRVSLEFIYGGAGHAWKEAFDYGGK